MSPLVVLVIDDNSWSRPIEYTLLRQSYWDFGNFQVHREVIWNPILFQVFLTFVHIDVNTKHYFVEYDLLVATHQRDKK